MSGQTIFEQFLWCYSLQPIATHQQAIIISSPGCTRDVRISLVHMRAKKGFKLRSQLSYDFLFYFFSFSVLISVFVFIFLRCLCSFLPWNVYYMLCGRQQVCCLVCLPKNHLYYFQCFGFSKEEIYFVQKLYKNCLVSENTPSWGFKKQKWNM